MKHLKKAIALMMSLLLVILLLPAAGIAEGETRITILGTSDLHGNIWGFSYEDNKETANNGIARLYTYIKQVREENPNTILLDNGDTIQGTIMTDDLYNKTPDEPHPVMAAMNFMAFDAMALGNHEFNWGIETMHKIIAQADFPVLSANVKDAEGKLVTGKGWVMIERMGIKIAVIGVVTPNVPLWDGGKPGIEEHSYVSGSVGVTEAIAEIGDSADLIVVCAHMGMAAEFDEEGGADSAQRILDDNPQVNVLLVGHYHMSLGEKQGDTLIAGVRNGREIARIDVTFDKDKSSLTARWKLSTWPRQNPARRSATSRWSKKRTRKPSITSRAAAAVRTARAARPWGPPPPASSRRTRSVACPRASCRTPR